MSEAGEGVARTFCTIRGPGGELLLSKLGELDWQEAVNDAAAGLVAAGQEPTVRAVLERLRPLGVDSVSAETQVALPAAAPPAPPPPAPPAPRKGGPMLGVLAGLTDFEMAWVVTFLEELGDRYSNDGCNELQLPATPEGRRLAAEAFRWATGEDERPAGPDGKPPCSDNNMVLGCLRAKLLAFCGWDDKGAAAVAAGRPGG